MLETESTNPANPVPEPGQKPGTAKWWLWLIPIVGVCLLLFCLAAGGGLAAWRLRGGTSEENAVVVPASPTPLATDQEEAAALPTALATPGSTSAPLPSTPTSLPSPAATPTVVDTPIPLPASCQVAEPPAQPTLAAPIFSSISFATSQDANGWPLAPMLQFTTDITKVQAFLGYAGMTDGLNWERVWYFGNQELTRGKGVWDAGPKGRLPLQVEAGEGGFVPGRYKLELYVGGQLLSQGTFLMVDPLTSTLRPVQVAYTTLNTATSQLNLLNLDNQQTQPLLEGGLSPTWSRNGIDLMFYSPTGVEGGERGVWVHNLKRNQNVQVIPEAFSNPISWSSDGLHVATSVTQEDKFNLVLWNVATGQALNGPVGDDPAWSPEGRRLAYRSCTEDGWNISTIELIGDYFDLETIQPLTSGDDSQPSWSWDGQRIAFVRNEDGNQDIYVMGVDGKNPVRLTEDPAIDSSPAWTPEGQIMFRSLRDGQWGLYLMEADGSDQRRLLETPSDPTWQPDPLAISTNTRFIEPTPTPTPIPTLQIPAGRGILVVSNGDNDEMTFTINNKEYKVPPHQARNITLPPGHYTWTASWPAQVGHNGIADIKAGQVSQPVVER